MTTTRPPTGRSTLPASIPCLEPGIPAATINRGPHRGRCHHRAELMGQLTPRPYYRCPTHGTVPWILTPTAEGATRRTTDA